MGAFIPLLVGNLVLFFGSTYGKASLSSRCDDSWTPGPSTVNTTDRLATLREQLQLYNLSAYIITSNDDHQSEYTATHEHRRHYISGFTGSAGEAVVTLDAAALWTDSRYYLQAENQLDCNWELIRAGEPEAPTIVQWLDDKLTDGDDLSANPRTVAFNEWDNWRTSLEKINLTLRVETDDLVDLIWEEQPPYPGDQLLVLDTKYAGKTWQEKLAILQEDMKKSNVDSLVLTALDEISWALNLRGADIPFTPVFRSYLVLQGNLTTVYIANEQISPVVKEHLNSNGNDGSESVRIKDYSEIWYDLESIGNSSTKIGLPGPYSYAQGVSYLIHTMLPADKISDMISPALLRKDSKNDVEAEGMRQAHVRDAVALCVFFARLEKIIQTGSENITELSAVKMLDDLRWKQPESHGPSFGTIAAVGTNAALPHYEPTEATNKYVTDRQLFLVDSGGQYFDGTTDVTRTVHFGTPRDIERRVYTKLLMGCIDIVTTVFPEGQTLSSLEILIRRPLYSYGLDYGHGSTHGIGSFLSVHEAFNSTFHQNFFGSQEPGYYKENDFGIRLENIVSVVKAQTMSGAENFLTFETTTLVPYQAKLIDISLLEKRQVEWLDNYHKKVQEIVGAEMKRQNFTFEIDWLMENTKPLDFDNFTPQS